MTEQSRGVPTAPEVIVPIRPAETIPTADIGTTPSIHEMPTSHAEVDLSALTVEGLIKACPHYAGIAAKNPELAEAKATEDLGHARAEEKRQAGMSKQEKEDDFWASIGDLVEVEKKPEPKAKAVPEVLVESASDDSRRQRAPELSRAAVAVKLPKSQMSEIVSGPPVESKLPPLPTVEPASPKPEMQPLVPLPTLPGSIAERLTSEASRAAIAAEQTRLSDVVEPGEQLTVVSSQGVEIPDFMSFSQPETGAAEVTEVGSFSPFLEGNTEVGDSAVSTETVPGRGTAETTRIPPVELFDRFTKAVAEFATTAELPTATQGVDWEAPYEQHSPGETPRAQVASEVANKLTELEPGQKEVVIPIIQNIIVSVQSLTAQQMKGESVEVIISSVEEVKQQVINLFEVIGMGYDDAKVEQFMQVLLDQEFAKQIKKLTAEELAHGYMHNVKLLMSVFGVLASDSADPDDRLTPVRQILGAVAIFTASPGSVLRLAQQLVPSKG